MAGWGNGVMLLLTPDDSRFAQQESDKIGGLGRYLQRVWPYRSIIAQAIAINIAIGLLCLTSPFMMQLLTDDVLVRGDTQLHRTDMRVQLTKERYLGINWKKHNWLLNNKSKH
jgi:ABC-type bacteriocin/lantibiotic exporter with double-glycine peptidase domain